MRQETENCVITYSIEEDEIIIDMIEVSTLYRGQGFAKKAMKKFMSDNYGKFISLHAYGQDDSVSTEKLVDFYKFFGFEVVAGSNDFGFEMQNNPY